MYLGERRLVRAIAASAPGRFLSAWWFAAWGFDWLYDKLFVQPFLLLSRMLARDPLDRLMEAIPRLIRSAHKALKVTVNGSLRWYSASMAAGAVLVIGIIVLG